jgi:hypothetical protein
MLHFGDVKALLGHHFHPKPSEFDFSSFPNRSPEQGTVAGKKNA